MQNTGSASLKLIKGNKLDVLVETQHLVNNGGPTLEDDALILEVADILNDSDEKTLHHFHTIMEPILTLETLLGFTFIKPHGYAGDYQLIDMIHTHHITKNKELENWDIMYQHLAASIALRNRKKYLRDLIEEEYAKKGKLHILNIACGPARDLQEFYDLNPNIDVTIDSVDMSDSALSYAKNVCRDHQHKLRFFNKNALRLKTDIQYDIVWSAGMFDYFNDRIFRSLIKRYMTFLKPDGVMALGNINVTNPHKVAMEVFGQWYLHHRSEFDLRKLVKDSDVKYRDIMIRTEPTTVDIFLHLRN